MVQGESNKWIIFIFLIVIAFPTIGAAKPKEETHKLLMGVNKNWADLENEIEYTFLPSSEQELVQLHLFNVVSYLESQSVLQLNKKQKENRLFNIEILRNYCEAGVFPINNLTPFRTPIFIADQNVHCAVGFLMKENGLESVTQEIAANQLLAYLKDIEHPQLNPWQKTSGLSLFELALIQPTYGPPSFVCATPVPVEWNKVTKEGSRITQLVEGENDNFIYGISELDDYGLKHEIKRYSAETQLWTSFGNQINGQILELVFCNNQMFVSVFLPAEKYPHQLLKLNRKKWEKIAHFDGNVTSIQSFQNKLYILGNFKRTSDSIVSNFVVVDGNSIEPFNAVGFMGRAFDHIKSSETALFLTNNGGVFKFKNDSINYLTGIKYYHYVKDFIVDAIEDTFLVSSVSLGGYNKYFDDLEHSYSINNMLMGKVQPYNVANFTKSKMINGNMIIAGDFRSSTMINQINDNRKLVKCADTVAIHWYGEGLLYQQEQMFYPVLNEGIVLDFVELDNRIYILKDDGSISCAELDEIEEEVGRLKARILN